MARYSQVDKARIQYKKNKNNPPIDWTRQFDKYLNLETISFLRDNNILKIPFEKIDQIVNSAIQFQEDIISYRRSNDGFAPRDLLFVELFNYVGKTMGNVWRGNVEKYKPLVVLLKTREENALFTMLLIDPNCDYYKTFLEAQENKFGILKNKYGFICKELLEIERLYYFIIKYRQKGYLEADIKQIGRKLYKLDDSSSLKM